MEKISAEDWEFLGLFEKEPERKGLDSIWFFDDSVYTVQHGNLRFTFAIHPYHKDVRLMLWELDNVIYDQEIMGVDDVLVSGDTLNIRVSKNESILVTVRPKIHIKHARKKT
jgi:hypothetical protein